MSECKYEYEGIEQTAMKLAESKREDIVKLVEKKLSENAYNFEKLFVEFLQEIFLTAIGFEIDWGKIRVDHCNGRKSAIAEQLSSAISEQAIKLLKQLDVTAIIADQMKDIKKAVICEIKDQKRYVIERAIEDAIDSKLDSYIEKHVDEFITDEDCKKLLSGYLHTNSVEDNSENDD